MQPLLSQLKKSVTMRPSKDGIEYFKGMAAKVGVPFHRLINLPLRGGLAQRRKVETKGPSAG